MVDSKYQIVTNHYVMSFIKNSKYFETNLGVAVTMERNGERILNNQDEFAGSYNYQYKTTIYAQGKIGNIFFYVDFGILENTLACYHTLEEFIFEFDEIFVQEKGISAYLGSILKQIDEQYQQRKKEAEERLQQEEERRKQPGQAEKLFNNPGAVTYEDIKAYIQQKRI